MNKLKIFLDDCRTPTQGNWVVARTYDEFVSTITSIGMEHVSIISLDHDLGEGAMVELINSENGEINYDNIPEKTGYHVAHFLVNHSMDSGIPLPQIFVHSFNPVGSDNIKSLINNYLKNCGLTPTCCQINIPFILIKPYPGIK